MFQYGYLVKLFGIDPNAASEYVMTQQQSVIYLVCLGVCLIISYLLGSINSGIIVSKILYEDDVREHGSGNAGLTNVYRTYNTKATVLTLLGDIVKVFISLFITAFFFGFLYKTGLSYQPLCYLSGLFCVIGHIKPIFYKFKGGKGVLCASATILLLAPFVFLCLLLVFVSLVAMTKYISVGSVAIAFFLPFTIQANMNILGAANPSITGLCALIGIIIIICHRANIKRLSHGEENKFHFKKKEN